ncbi:MAG: hypothetical protein IT462_08665 [Planctomycetes bacterium]|nr:hypothetical protein [Planctomycetota bacterium]
MNDHQPPSTEPFPHPYVLAAIERRLVQRKRLAGMGASIMLGLFAVGITLLSSCQSIPTETLGGGAGGDATTYAQLVSSARELYVAQPRNEERLRKCVEKFAAAAKIKGEDYAMLNDAARAYVWLASYAGDTAERIKFSKEGLKYTSTAIKLQPEGAEALYYHAVLSGRLGDNDHSYGLDAVGIIERNCKKVIELGKEIDNGGAHRVYGALLIEAPGPPTSIGSLRNGRKQLELALQRAPDWPENHYWMARLEFKWAREKDKPEDAQKARDRIEKYLLGPTAKAPAEMQHEFMQWQALARKMLDEYR